MISKGGNSLNEIKRRSAFSFAFPIMAPMGISLFVIGLGFGLYATSQGLPWWTAPVLAATIFAGSMEFVTIGMLVAGFDVECLYFDHVRQMAATSSMVYLRCRNMYIWGGNGFLP